MQGSVGAEMQRRLPCWGAMGMKKRTLPEQLAHGKDMAMEAMLFSLYVVVSC
jgi:hypothetical protein